MSNYSLFLKNYNSNLSSFRRFFVYRNNFSYFIDDYFIRFDDVKFIKNKICYISDISEKSHLFSLNRFD